MSDTPLAHRTDGTGHWMLFDAGRIVGCQCGYRTDTHDYSCGDDYLDHFEAVVRAEERAASGADLGPHGVSTREDPAGPIGCRRPW